LALVQFTLVAQSHHGSGPAPDVHGSVVRPAKPLRVDVQAIAQCGVLQNKVLAVENHGEAVAYPIRLMAYHHVVHDRVGGTPIVATY
jgi:hypothetical protein